MAIGDTKNIVPRGDQQGKIGTAAKSWAQLFLEIPHLVLKALRKGLLK